MRQVEIIRIRVRGGACACRPIESMPQVLETSSFIEGSRKGVTCNIIDRFLRSQYFAGQAKVFVSSREGHTRETR